LRNSCTTNRETLWSAIILYAAIQTVKRRPRCAILSLMPILDSLSNLLLSTFNLLLVALRFSLGPGIPEPTPGIPAPQMSGDRIPYDHRVVGSPVLGGLRHEYRLERIAA